MSETQQEMEDFLQDALFPGKPKSVGEALAASASEQEEQPEPVEEPAEDAPVVVKDEPAEPAPPPPPEPEAPAAPEEAPSEEGEEIEALAEDENVVWAKKKYGDDTAKWAKAARDQEQHISRLANEKREAEDLAGQWYEYAQEAESQAAVGMPLSASQEAWVEQAMGDPLNAAWQAAVAGDSTLYNAIVQRVNEESPVFGAQIANQVQQGLAQLQAEQQQPSLAEALGGSFQRLGIDLQAEGPRMAEKIAELGEYNPYVQAIMAGDDSQRDLAVQAVYDLTRATSLTTRRSAKNANIERENELRRDAMVVQTGGIQPPPPPKPQSTFLSAMEQEWKDRGQWQEDEG